MDVDGCALMTRLLPAFSSNVTSSTHCTKERRRFVIAFVNKGSLDAIGTRLPIDQPSLRMLSDVDAMCQNYILQKQTELMERCQAAPSLPYALFNICIVGCPSSFAATQLQKV